MWKNRKFIPYFNGMSTIMFITLKYPLPQKMLPYVLSVRKIRYQMVRFVERIIGTSATQSRMMKELSLSNVMRADTSVLENSENFQ